jgi:hypothetical protein
VNAIPLASVPFKTSVSPPDTDIGEADEISNAASIWTVMPLRARKGVGSKSGFSSGAGACSPVRMPDPDFSPSEAEAGAGPSAASPPDRGSGTDPSPAPPGPPFEAGGARGKSPAGDICEPSGRTEPDGEAGIPGSSSHVRETDELSGTES